MDLTVKITTPKPFVRDICGKGNRVRLDWDAVAFEIVLRKQEFDLWESPLTMKSFRRAVRSIAQERAEASMHQVDVYGPDRTHLYCAPYHK